MSSVAFLGPQNALKSLAAGALPHTTLGELIALPIARIKGPTSRARRDEGVGREREGKREDGRGVKVIYMPPGARNPRAATGRDYGL